MRTVLKGVTDEEKTLTCCYEKKGKNEINKYELYTPKNSKRLDHSVCSYKTKSTQNDFLLKAFEPCAILTEGTWHENV